MVFGFLKKDEVKDPLAFPYKQLTVLAICRFAEPIAFNSIMAYSYAMTKDLTGTEDGASFYSGLLVSAYAVAETCTAMGWGMLSDRWGRKPIVLSGLAGVALSCMILGFAKNYWVAFAARLIGGALNGNVSVMQTMVAESVKVRAHEPAAYATQPFVWVLGGLIGSAMGGYLAKPAEFYPGVFAKGSIWDTFPYLLPNIASFIIIAISIIQGAFLLEETNPLLVGDEPKDIDNDSVAEDETSPLDPNKNKVTLHRDDTAISDESTPLMSQDTAFGTMAASGSGNTVASSASSQTIAADTWDGKITNKTVINLVVALFIFSYHQMAFVTLVPIHVIDEPSVPKGHLDLYGGFGMSLHDVSTFLAAEGGSSLFIQAFIFPFLLRRLGVWWTFVCLISFYPVCYVILPFLWAAPKFLFAGVYIALVLQAFCGITLNPAILILLKNACPDRRALGRVMGLGMSACCLARTIAPPLAGIIYDAGGSGAAWFSCCGVALIGIVQMMFVPRMKEVSADDEMVVAAH